MFRTVFGKILLIVIVLEVSLGGGGRLFDSGPISPRMVLFGLGLAYAAAALLYRDKMPREFVVMTVLFVGLSGMSALISGLQNRPMMEALGDFKPLAYFLMLPFFAVTIRNMEDVVLVGRLLKCSALILAALYLAIMMYWKSGGMTAKEMFNWLNPTISSAEKEFIFRGGITFFFKALLYVGIGVLFFVVERKRNWYAAVLMLLLAIAITMTRGMWLAVFMVLAAWVFWSAADRLKGTALAAGFLLVGVTGVVVINQTLPSVVLSNAVRVTDLKGIKSAKLAEDVTSVLFGHGFGAEVLGRKSIEITYLNVFVKQGLVGILFWFLPAGYLAWQLRCIRDAALRSLAMPYVLAAAFVYVVSLTNPFLTNPIGMAVILIAMVAVRAVRHSDCSKVLMEPGPHTLAC